MLVELFFCVDSISQQLWQSSVLQDQIWKIPKNHTVDNIGNFFGHLFLSHKKPFLGNLTTNMPDFNHSIALRFKCPVLNVRTITKVTKW